MIDLGCGPGTSTQLLRERWPAARITALDSSPDMIAEARNTDPSIEWVLGDVRAWRPTNLFDLVFSNAALQWVPDHEGLFPRLFASVASGGTLAVQMPNNSDPAASRCVRAVSEDTRWASQWSPDPQPARVGPLDFYYDLLASQASEIALWETEYHHVLPGAGSILEWFKGTALRPFLQELPSSDQDAFLTEVERRLRISYPAKRDGNVLFPFRRLFVVARRA